MDVQSNSDEIDEARRRRRSSVAIKQSLRDLRLQLSLLHHLVGEHLDLNDVDLDCLDLVSRQGPLSPSALARHAGLHPATVTGVLDRLEKGGWVARDRDPSDRRAVPGARPAGSDRGADAALRRNDPLDGRDLRGIQRRRAGARSPTSSAATADAGRGATKELAEDPTP